MPVRKLTQQELEEILGGVIVMPGPKPLPQSTVSLPELSQQVRENPSINDARQRASQSPKEWSPIKTFDPNGPETEEDGIRAEALRRLKVRRLSPEAQGENRALSKQIRMGHDSAETATIKNAESNGSPAYTPSTEDSCISNDQELRVKQVDLLSECISDLNSQLQEWLGFDIPAEGTEDYEIWQMKISLIEQVESISDVYELCEGGDFNLPSVLKDEADE